jgi:hypothetical protein
MTIKRPAPEPEPKPALEKMTITVRTSVKPHEELEVSEAEHRDLEYQRLLVWSEKKGARLRGQSEGTD